MILKKTLYSILTATAMMTIMAGCSDKGDGVPDNPVTPDNPPTPTQTFTKRFNADLSFYSNILKQMVTYSICLPQEYLTNKDETFPVMYLCHGIGSSHESWGPGHTLNIETVDKNARSYNEIAPIIYVMPDGYESYYVNAYDGSFNYMDMFIQELVPMIDNMLRTRPQAQYRAVAGYSMGGFGVLALASKNLDVFGTCIALSPSLNTDEQYKTLGAWDKQWGSIFGGVGTTGEPRLTAYYKQMCPLHFFADKPSQYASCSYYIDCGDDEERLYVGNGELHSLMRDKNIKHEYRVRNGAHTSNYWANSLMHEGLAFFTDKINGKTYPEETAVTIPQATDPTEISVADAPCPVTLFTGKGYKGNDNTNIVYMEVGQGPAALTDATVVRSFASNLNIKNMALAVIHTADAADATAESIFSAVDNSLGITGTDKHRHALVYGKGVRVLTPMAYNNYGSFYIYDSDFIPANNGRLKAEKYGVDITDNGTHYKEAQASFCNLRAAGVKAEYRVHNGSDNETCAQYGLYNLVQLMVSNFMIN